MHSCVGVFVCVLHFCNLLCTLCVCAYVKRSAYMRKVIELCAFSPNVLYMADTFFLYAMMKFRLRICKIGGCMI